MLWDMRRSLLHLIFEQGTISCQFERRTKPRQHFGGVNSHGKDCLYKWKFLPFGLKNAPTKFQRVIDRILTGLDFVQCYINDIVVYSDIVEEHQIHLQIVFVVAYASRSNNATESHYSSYEGECLAMVWVVAHFRCYLFGTQFTLVTDHQPFKWLMESDKLIGKLARWALILHEYDFQVVHKPGVANFDANGLSRNPCTNLKDNIGARWHGEVDEEMGARLACIDLFALVRCGL